MSITNLLPSNDPVSQLESAESLQTAAVTVCFPGVLVKMENASTSNLSQFIQLKHFKLDFAINFLLTFGNSFPPSLSHTRQLT